jgi:hypothetical protein
MGCSVRFAGKPGRTKERRHKRLAGQNAARAAKAKEKPARLSWERSWSRRQLNGPAESPRATSNSGDK